MQFDNAVPVKTRTLTEAVLAAYARRRAQGFREFALAGAHQERPGVWRIPNATWRAALATFPRIEPPTPSRGLGDMVAAIAQPIARAVDRLLGTHLAKCPGCKRRRDRLNRMGRRN